MAKYSELTDSAEGDTATLIDAIERLGWPIPVDIPTDGVLETGEDRLVALPEGRTLHSLKPFLDQWRARPERRKGTAELQDLASLITHVNRFKDEDSVLYGYVDADTPRLLAVLDYHQAGPAADGGQRWGEHRAHYRFPLSKEWKDWLEMNGKLMLQSEFAAFLEDHLPDVIEPPASLWRATVARNEQEAAGAPAPQDQGGDFGELTADERLAMIVAKLNTSVATPQKLLELSRGLHLHAEETVVNLVNLQSGEGEIRFKEEHKDAAGQPVKVPGLFLIAIPIFLNGDRYRLAVRLRYRKKGPALLWGYEIYELERSLDHAIREACQSAAEATELPLLYGRPEGDRS